MDPRHKENLIARRDHLQATINDPDVGRFYSTGVLTDMQRELDAIHSELAMPTDGPQPRPPRLASWTVIRDGRVELEQAGTEYDRLFPQQVKAMVGQMLLRPGDCHATAELFRDGTQVLTIKSLR